MAETPAYRGGRAASIRQLLGLSQQELAALLGISRDSVKQWESGKTTASAGVVADIQTLVDQHTAETAALLADQAAGRPLILRPGAMPRGWYVALGARVIDRHPDAAPTIEASHA